GRTIDVASMGWYPGTPGKIQGDVVVVKARDAKELEAYKGKLRGAIILSAAPTQLRDLKDLEKDGPLFMQGKGAGKGRKFNFEQLQAFQKERSEFLLKEGVA